ncbi:Uncharacterised protein [Streptococcus pyogenes]|nr:Uncharacterised protein [Streptococcus pyogenes]
MGDVPAAVEGVIVFLHDDVLAGVGRFRVPPVLGDFGVPALAPVGDDHVVVVEEVRDRLDPREHIVHSRPWRQASTAEILLHLHVHGCGSRVEHQEPRRDSQRKRGVILREPVAEPLRQRSVRQTHVAVVLRVVPPLIHEDEAGVRDRAPVPVGLRLVGHAEHERCGRVRRAVVHADAHDVADAGHVVEADDVAGRIPHGVDGALGVRPLALDHPVVEHAGEGPFHVGDVVGRQVRVVFHREVERDEVLRRAGDDPVLPDPVIPGGRVHRREEPCALDAETGDEHVPERLRQQCGLIDVRERHRRALDATDGLGVVRTDHHDLTPKDAS